MGQDEEPRLGFENWSKVGGCCGSNSSSIQSLPWAGAAAAAMTATWRQ